MMVAASGERGARAMRYRLSTVILASLALVTATVHPPRADTTKGSQLARQWCANSHATGSNSAGNFQQGPPSFPTIARTRTPEQLRAFLSHPHGAMPDLSLTRAEIDDLNGYIETLR